jgi:hypothetical protein
VLDARNHAPLAQRECAAVEFLTPSEHVAKRIIKERVRNGKHEPSTIASQFQQRFLASWHLANLAVDKLSAREA